MLVRIIHSVFSWSDPENVMEHKIRKTFCNFLSDTFGEQHPVVVAVVFIVQNKLDLSTYQGFLRISDAKLFARSSTSKQTETIIDWSRQCYIAVLWHNNELQKMEEIINSWSPASTFGLQVRLVSLARVREAQGRFDEGEVLYQC